MIQTVRLAALATITGLMASAAIAQAPPAGTRGDRSGGGAAEFSASTACDEAHFTAAEASMMKMPHGANKARVMREMAQAHDMMAKKDVAACGKHMTEAMTMMK
jgi:hypothetical protein